MSSGWAKGRKSRTKMKADKEEERTYPEAKTTKGT
jgi:hypothetical protein